MPRPIPHIVWKKDRLRLLDQRLLPRRIVYVDCRTASEVARAIKDMVLRGAPLIGCSAAFGMALAARRRSARALEEAGRLLVKSRPTAVNLAHAVGAMRSAAETVEPARLPAVLARAAEGYYRWDLESNRRMAGLGARLLRKCSRVVTHCNAGALATSGIGTALGVVAEAFRQGRISHVYADETRPYLQGSRLTLWELMQEGIPCTLITDSMAAHLMKISRFDAVIVGADRIAANGDVCNKIGTYGLAIVARHHGVPFYAVAPTTTIDPGTPDGSRIPIEERSPAEVLEISGIPIAPRGARARHFAFDVTPARLVTAIVTEGGIVRPVCASGIKRLLAARPCPKT
ncbi:MAG: S-methyl-5-thioribose-1-phosphate isomerase [Elusimicrobia bacterium]|nr:S-methyl-5-thioribose-1-phosphate isomerase [Elusimicrobiota bacterium]